MSIATEAAEILAEHEPRGPHQLAVLCGCTIPELIMALDAHGDFTRVAGAGCWWWERDLWLVKRMGAAD